MGVGRGGNGIVENGENVSMFWIKLFHNAFIVVKLSKYFKVAKHAPMQVLGSIKDKRTYSSLFFLNNKLLNKLSSHFHLVVHIFAQRFLHGKTFPYQVAIFD